ncbi:hypothetical protein ACFFGV_04880 [Pontibacillus salicampi]|uniref:DUF2564 family protein n=1 Tax=Pontibacillus salicampi TaxID=1449801 RepID=A0ABV6LKL3_9BACI
MSEQNFMKNESYTLLNTISFVKKSTEAYRHAKETTEQGSPIAADIAEACAWICRDSAQRLKELEPSQEQLVDICYLNALLCEELKQGNE